LDIFLEYRRRFNANAPQWRNAEVVRRRYRKLCEDAHISPNFYDPDFEAGKMSFRKNSQEVDSAIALMGKDLIVTDNSHWSTEDIVLASLDRYKVENQFRTRKNPYQVRVNPMSHWTDGKIRCHLLTCMIALTALRLLELKLGDKYTSKVIMEEMHDLDCVFTWYKDSKEPELGLETPSELQADILKDMGYVIKDAWALQSQ
jgi:hypothetical protein